MTGDQKTDPPPPEPVDEYKERLRRALAAQEECQREYVRGLLRYSLTMFTIAAAGVLLGYAVWWKALRPATEEPPLPPLRSDPAAPRAPF